MAAYVPATRIRIPTFSSPVKRSDAGPSTAANQPLTREEARAGRLNPRLAKAGGGGGWTANFQELLKKAGSTVFTGSTQQQPKQPQKRRSSIKQPRASTSKAAPRQSQERKSTSAAAAGPAEGEAGPTKKRRSSAAPAPKPRASTSAAANKARASAAADPTPKQRISPRKSLAKPPSETEAPKKRRSSVKAPPARTPAREPQPARRVPRASVAASRKGKERAVEAVEELEVVEDVPMEEVEVEEDAVPVARKAKVAPAPAKAPRNKKRPAPPPEPEPEPEDAAEHVVKKNKAKVPKSAPAPSLKKKRRVSPPSSPATVSSDEPALSEPEIEQDDEEDEPELGDESSDDEDEGGARGGVRVRTERLQGNEGRLNALDLVWERSRAVLKAAMEGVRPSPTLVALRDYTQRVQLTLLTRSDSMSALSHAASLASAARNQAKALRGELLGVRRDRNELGARMRAEETAWRDGTKRGRRRREVHRFVGELEVGAMEWNAVQSGAKAEVPLRARLERVQALVGGQAVVRRAERLNRKLESYVG